MRVIYNSELPNLQPCVATIGFFDGIHAGHRFLLQQVKALAIAQQCESAVITFDNHPRAVLLPDYRPKLLTTLAEKITQIESTGIDLCVILPFTPEMARLSAYDFLKTKLKEQFNVRALIIGHDHRFGFNRNDGFDEYKEIGDSLNIDVIQAERYSTDKDLQISSSQIRAALLEGEIEQCNRLLTYSYSLQGRVVEGFKMGRQIGYPTANIEVLDAYKIIPSHGVYAVWVHWKMQSYKGMLNIGMRPTLNNGLNVSIEVHLLDFDQDLYGELMEIEFIQKIREEQKFDSLSDLTEQLGKDKLLCERILKV